MFVLKSINGIEKLCSYQCEKSFSWCFPLENKPTEIAGETHSCDLRSCGIIIHNVYDSLYKSI